MAKFFTAEEEKRLIAAIAKAESKTSGEIRLHLDARCKGSALDTAVRVFRKLHMHETELRNGVLFYLAWQDHKFAILGDQGINDVVPDNFWEAIKDQMAAAFREGRFADGLEAAILEAGKSLAEHFPIQDDDTNELSNEISYGS